MTDKHSPQDHDPREAFLDDLLSAEQAKALLDQSDSPEEILAEKDLQNQIDQSLRRMFQFSPPSIAQLSPDTNHAKSTDVASPAETINLASTTDGEPTVTTDAKPASTSKGLRLFWGCLAASLFLLVGLNLWQGNGVDSPTFSARPVAELYEQTVKIGFRPYYDCNEPEKFAHEFKVRQGMPLVLGNLTDGTSMLGISYPPALSRNTTAVLFKVNDTPVMVFVDNQEADQEKLALTAPEDLRVFRRAENGLVFYEVTPLSSASVIDSIEFMQ